MRTSRPWHMARAFGQAMAENRPHLVASGSLTPNIAAAEYAARRRAVAERMPSNSLAIFPGNAVQFATPSVFHQFRQDPTFQYLTGFQEPGALLLLHKPNSAGSAEEILFVPPKNAFAEKWEGERTGPQLAAEAFGIADARGASPATIRDSIAVLVKNATTVFADIDPATTARQGIYVARELAAAVGGQRRSVRSARGLVEPSRLLKSEAEIDCLRTAAEVSSAAFNAAFRQQFVSERQLAAYLEFMFIQGGCDEPAYVPVVAGGDHALTIHYVRNDDLLSPDELVLVDAGGRYGGYCADISRTWPSSGRFSQPQRDLYAAVLAVNKACIAQCTEEAGITMSDLQAFSVEQMRIELANAGLPLRHGQVADVYVHSIGHNLGLDVHDGPQPATTTLRANQVITIEPGVYVPYDDAFPRHFQGIGIRIEDDVVVGKAHYEVLTADCLKEIDELER